MKKLLLSLLIPGFVLAQYGPNSPSTGANITGTGTLSWDGPANIFSSNNSVSSRYERGISNYLRGTNFGFNLPVTNVVTGIELEIEKRASPPSNVIALDDWVIGTNRAVPTGNNRCLIVVIGMENASGPRNVTAVTYGNRPMTQIAEVDQTNDAYARIEAWYLLESDLSIAENTTIAYTVAGVAPLASVEIVSSVVCSNVNQFSPVYDVRTAGMLSSDVTEMFYASAMNIPEGGLPVTGIFAGAAPTYMDPDALDAFSVGEEYSEGFDIYEENPSYPGEGASMMAGGGYAIDEASTSQPPYLFFGPASQCVFIGLSLSRTWSTDNSVRLTTTGGFKGVDKAKITDVWPMTNDEYVTYGGPSDLWGTTWSVAEINSPDFGAAISAIIQNGGVSVDHMRITVYTVSVLPLELISFTGTQKEEKVICSWLTASENNTDRFIIDRSSDGLLFETVGIVNAAGNSYSALAYEFADEHPEKGTNYYQLKTIDGDGSVSESEIIAVHYKHDQEATIFPNPAYERATVWATEGFHQLIISNANGTVIDNFETTALQTEKELNLEQLPEGVYFVRLTGKDGMTQIQKLTVTGRGM